MTSINFTLPDNIAWGDYLLDGRSVTVSVEVKSSIPEKKDEIVYIQKESAVPEPRKWNRSMPWCKRGNACPWANCKFRHERCKHHDQWTASGCKDRPCRSLKYDPLSNKCPTDGGCMYDHRDRSDLKMFIEVVEVNSHEDLMNNFKDLGLVHMSGENYHVENMKKEDKQLFIRSLRDARDNDVLQYGDELDGFMIHFIID